ncbi:MAG: hypothetical protein V7767_14105 [Leeuwenhoekiella sp.]
MKELIRFKKQREIGEIITDTFKFIRLEYKPLFKALIKNVALSFIFLLIAVGYYTSIATDFSLFAADVFRSGDVIIAVLFLLVTLMLYYGFLYGTVLNYIKSYIKNQGEVDQDEISECVRSNLGRLLGLGVVSAIMVFFGLVCCIIPGIYFMVPLTVVFPLMVFKRVGITDSISESFILIKGEWWMTFITIIILGLIVYLIQMVFQIPVLIYTIMKGLASSDEISNGDFTSMFDWVYVTLNVISSAVSYILYTVSAITSAFIYFNLNESKNQTGTFEKIDSIGDSN